MALSLSAAKKKAKELLPYQNPKLSVEQRVNDLVSRMTLQEKVGQLRCTLAWNYYTIKGKNVEPSELFKKDIAEGQIGMLWGTYRADPGHRSRSRTDSPPNWLPRLVMPYRST